MSLEVREQNLSNEEFLERIAQQLSLNLEEKGIDYMEESQDANEKIQKLMHFLLAKYRNFLYLFLIESPNVKQALFEHLPDAERP